MTATISAPAVETVEPAARPSLPLWAALLVAAGSGLALVFAYPSELVPFGIPLVALLAPGGILIALQGRGVGSAALVGFLGALAFYLLHTTWMTEFLRIPGVQWVPWAALAVFVSAFAAAGGILIALAYRWLPRVLPTTAGRILVLPSVVAGLWTAREALVSVFPYGGFAWGRVGLSQGQGAFKELYSWIGVSGMTFLCVLIAAVLLALVQTTPRPAGPTGMPLSRLAALRGAGFAAVLAMLALVPAWPVVDAGTVRVAAVQGNGKTAYFDPPARPGDNLLAQAKATEPAFGEDVDVVVWPEGGSDLDPLRSAEAAAVFDAVSAQTGAPLVSGTITARLPDDGDPQAQTRYYNTALVWRAGEGGGDFYDKRHPVPFGEYVPDRAFFRLLVPGLVDLIARDYTPGTTDAVLELDNGVLAGAAICYDIVDDALMRDIVAEGASILFAPTNNADFGQSIESAQQLEIARVRALELGRAVVNISTVGTSAIILPDGAEIARLPRYQPGIMIADVPLSTAVTPAMLLGRWIEIIVAGLALAGLVASGILARRRGSPDLARSDRVEQVEQEQVEQD